MKDEGEQLDGEPILFWPSRPGVLREYVERKITHPVVRAFAAEAADVAEVLIGQMAKHEPGQPMEFVRDDVPAADRELVARVLAAGKRGISYMGYAECRICGSRLGVADLYGYGFVWPERADHYVIDHNVWTPGCEKLLEVLRSRGVR